MFVYLRDKFEVSSIILTGFRHDPPPPPSPQNENLKSSPRLGLTDKWKILLHSKGDGVVPVDPSQNFDTFNHDLLIPKLHAYGFPEKSLKLIKRSLSIRWQGTKVNLSFSICSELTLGVPS